MARKKMAMAMLLASAVAVGGAADAKTKTKTIKTATAITADERKQGSEAHPELVQEFGGMLLTLAQAWTLAESDAVYALVHDGGHEFLAEPALKFFEQGHVEGSILR